MMGKHTGKYHTNHATYPMTREYIQGVVDTCFTSQIYNQITNQRANQANDHCMWNTDKNQLLV
jgi:hypothetical protein